MIGKSGKHYNNPNVARAMNDVPDVPAVDLGGLGEEAGPGPVEVHKAGDKYQTVRGDETQDHADFASLIEHLRELLSAHDEGDDDADEGAKPVGKGAMSLSAKGPAPMGSGGGLSSLSSL